MHNAPSVSYPVGRCAILGWLPVAAWLAAGLVCGQVVWTADSAGWPAAALAAVWIVCCVPLVTRKRQAAGVLVWDGLRWHWQEPGHARDAETRRYYDAQSLILLEMVVNEEGRWRRQWVCLRAVVLPERWADLRRALCTPARPEASPRGRA